jgi:peptidyl-prolyl cis-trans isomerase D
MYTIDKELRSGSYVSFDIIPSSADTGNSLGKIMSLQSELGSSTDLATFISSNSDMIYDKEYYASGRAETPKLDSAHKAPVGAIVGPYYEDGMFKLTKIVDRKSIPDSVRTSHILAAITKDFGEEAAKKRIDSFELAIKAGMSFEQLASTSSDDGGSKAKGGDLGYQPKGVMVSEYNDFMFSGAKGEMKKVKTRFGWHLIKIVDQKDYQSSTQSVTLAKKLIAGDETKNKQYTAATNFLKSVKDKKTFEEQAKKLGLSIRNIEAASKTQSALSGLDKARELVRFLFDNKTGKVSSIINAESSYVVGLVGDVMAKGLAPVKLVKERLSNDIKNNKKTKLIGDQYKGMDLSTIAAKAGVQVMSADTVRQEGESSQLINQDKRVCGAAFNKNAKASVVGPIQGFDGVYFIKTKNVIAAPTSSADPITVGQERNMQMSQMMQNLGRALPLLLQKRAKIEDNRGLFF